MNETKNEIKDEKGKQIIEMYIVARQFKNAIDVSEMLIIPASKNNLPSETKLNMGGLITITARGNKMISKFFPFIVNKAFACEVLLKIIISINDLEVPKGNDGHKLSFLYDSINSKIDLNKHFFTLIKDMDKEQLNKEIENISNVFVDWRYIYEKSSQAKTANYGFLNWFCEELDRYVIDIIKEKYDYDVEKDCR